MEHSWTCGIGLITELGLCPALAAPVDAGYGNHHERATENITSGVSLAKLRLELEIAEIRAVAEKHTPAAQQRMTRSRTPRHARIRKQGPAMDASRLEEITRQVAAADSRRGILETPTAETATAMGSAIARQHSAEAAFGFCRAGGFPAPATSSAARTVAGQMARASAPRKANPASTASGPNCCSRKCREGKCN